MNWFFIENPCLAFVPMKNNEKKIKIERVEEIKKDLKKLKKKFNTIDKDLERFEKVLLVSPRISGAVPISSKTTGVKTKPEVDVYKAKRFRCVVLNKGSDSGMRVIYGFWSCFNKITIEEIYYKGQKSECDLDRLKYYFGIDK